MARRIRTVRRGLGKGRGKGYRNMIGKDPAVHSQSAKGMKQIEKSASVLINRLNRLDTNYLIGNIDRKKYLKQRSELRKEKDKFIQKIKNKMKDSDGDGVPDKFDCRPNDASKQDDDYYANEIYRQLGGNRFKIMTGAKNFVKNDKEKYIAFRIGRNSKGINLVKIKLNEKDLYDMEFSTVRKGNVYVKSKVNDVYNDQLQEIFTENTGLYTTL